MYVNTFTEKKVLLVFSRHCTIIHEYVPSIMSTTQKRKKVCVAIYNKPNKRENMSGVDNGMGRKGKWKVWVF